MTPQIIGGFFLMALGAVILFGGFDSVAQRSSVRMGEVHASVVQRRAVPLWVGGGALVSGVVLVLVGARRRSRFYAA